MQSFATYPDALRWLYARNQFAMKLGLENPRNLLAKLGNPEAGGVFLHVAGTNGKGSVCANLAAMLPALGYSRIGLYTSPHLVSFRERIRVDGAPIPREAVLGWMNRSLPILEAFNVTYFECVTALALWWFREQGCEASVLETGLGGRLDATTVVTPRVTVITSISLDHTAILGDTLEAIWGEKLGIAKPGVPLVVDEGRPALAALAEKTARAVGAPFLNLADHLAGLPKDGDEGALEIRGQWKTYALPPDLRAEAHQRRNAALSVLTLEAFFGKALPAEATWLPALRAARLPGRTQTVEGDGRLPVVLDGAHNPAGVEALCRHLSESKRGAARIFFAVMRDKDFLPAFRALRSLSTDIVFLDLGALFPRALKAAELREALAPEERTGLREAPISWDALEPLLRPGTGADYAVVCGSLYLLGEIIPLLLPHYRGLEAFRELVEEDGRS